MHFPFGVLRSIGATTTIWVSNFNYMLAVLSIAWLLACITAFLRGMLVLIGVI